MKKNLFVRIICIVLALTLVVSVGFVAVTAFTASAAEIDASDSVGAGSVTGYVSDDYVNLRSGAGTGYSIVTCMRKNTSVTFISTSLHNSNWYNIRLNDGKTGYVHKDYVKMNSSSSAPSSSSATGYVSDDYVNLRSGAGTSYSIVICMRKNTKFTFLNSSLVNSNWYNIKLNDGKKGYVHKDYIKKDTTANPGTPATPSTPTSVTTGYVSDDYVNLRSGAGTGYSVVICMRKNTKFTFLNSSLVNSNWYNIKLNDGKKGYVHKDYIKKDSATNPGTPSTPSSKATGYVSDDYVNLRSGAGTGYSVVVCMRKNTAFTLISDNVYNSNWYNIKLNDGKTGYVHKDYAKINQSTAATVSLSNTSINLVVGGTYTLTAKVSQSGADKGCVWSSNNTSVATVSNSGKVTGVKAGSATITVKLTNGNSASCIVVVKAKDEPQHGSLRLACTAITLYTGNQFYIKAYDAKSSVSWSSSNTNVATVSNGLVNAKTPGTATITAKSGSDSATCIITVKSGSNVTISNSSATISCGKSIRLTSNSSVRWSSSDANVATVKNGIVDTKRKGTAVIFALTSNGAATCLITVNDRDNVRFCYASPNSAPLNSTVTFKAITDNSKTAVRFVVTNGSTSYTIDANKKSADGSNYIWSGSRALSKSGKWTIKAYSKSGGSNNYLTTPVNGEGEVFVTASTDKTTTVCAERRASDEVINLIANYEGFLSSVTADVITSDPTLGYGKVVTSGEQFYNNITRNEAFAYLCQTVNSGGYTTRTNKYLIDNGIKFNQRQFDALVCFTYNVGAGVFYNDSTIQSVLLNTGSGASISKGTAGYISGDDVNLRSGAGTSHSVLVCMAENTKFTFIDGKVYNSNWYKIRLSNGVEGYVFKTYAAASGGSRDLNSVNKQAFVDAFLQYHHAAGSCYWGLLYRRVDEAEVFFYGDYDRDGQYNYNHFNFSCYNNRSFKIS